MIIWLDAHLSPAIAAWINRTFPNLQAQSIRSLGLQYATDREIFEGARNAHAVIMSKDADFLKLIKQFGVPPYLIWISCGNTSNQKMREILTDSLEKAVQAIERGEAIVQISELRGHD